MSRTNPALPGGGKSYVHLSPSEYLVYGIEYSGVHEDVPRLRLFANNQQEYRITDHLASVRTTLNQSGTVTGTHDYEPFGDIISGGTETRQGFNSREKDQEVALFNNGVRKLDDEEGQFTSIDPLWEKFPAWSPYQYGYNNPLRMTDPGGRQALALGTEVVGGGLLSTAAAGGSAGILGGFFVWGIYRDINPTAEDIATTKTAVTEGAIYTSMEYNSAAAPAIPVVNMAEHTKGARPSTKSKHEKGQARKRQRVTDRKRAKDGWDQNPNKRKTGKKQARKVTPTVGTEVQETETNHDISTGSSGDGISTPVISVINTLL